MIFNKKNKRGMLAQIIGGFVTVLIAVSLMGTVSQEINNALTCGTNQTNVSVAPGKTDSFGGGGVGSFGGYDGIVRKSWSAGSNFAPYKTNETISGLCLGGDTQSASAMKTMIQIIPGFFALGILAVVILILYSSMRDMDFM
jgi:hypothetical protein